MRAPRCTRFRPRTGSDRGPSRPLARSSVTWCELSCSRERRAFSLTPAPGGIGRRHRRSAVGSLREADPITTELSADVATNVATAPCGADEGRREARLRPQAGADAPRPGQTRIALHADPPRPEDTATRPTVPAPAKGSRRGPRLPAAVEAPSGSRAPESRPKCCPGGSLTARAQETGTPRTSPGGPRPASCVCAPWPGSRRLTTNVRASMTMSFGLVEAELERNAEHDRSRGDHGNREADARQGRADSQVHAGLEPVSACGAHGRRRLRHQHQHSDGDADQGLRRASPRRPPARSRARRTFANPTTATRESRSSAKLARV